MKTYLSLALLLSAFGFVSAHAADTTASVAFKSGSASNAGFIRNLADNSVEIGQTRAHVSRTIGHPSLRLSQDAWVYDNVEVAVSEQPTTRTVLVIAFADGKVSGIWATTQQHLDALVNHSRTHGDGAARMIVASLAEGSRSLN